MVEPGFPAVGTWIVRSEVTVRPVCRIVLDRLPEGDAEREDEQHDQDPDAPADQLPAALLAPALGPFDRGQGAHGA